jgi:hypothetical protein
MAGTMAVWEWTGCWLVWKFDGHLRKGLCESDSRVLEVLEEV